MANVKKRVDFCGAVLLAGLMSLCGIPALRAEDGAGAQDQTAPPPGSGTSGADAASGPAAISRPKAKPLTIAAGHPEAARLKLLGTVLPGQPVRIVAAAPGADFSVQTRLQPEAAPEKDQEAKLFTEQLHIVAGANIANVADLRGRPVSFGLAGSDGAEAARKAFAALGVSVQETPLDLDNALDGVATGDIDAVAVLAPQPFERLAQVKKSGLHFLSWPEGGPLPDGAAASSIEGNHYPGLSKPGETIRAVGVDAVLTLTPKGAKQRAAKALLTALTQHSTSLSKRGFDLLKADAGIRSRRRLASAAR
jgi:hypothetical protein